MNRGMLIVAIAAMVLAAAGCAGKSKLGEGSRLEWLMPTAVGQCNQALAEIRECGEQIKADGAEVLRGPATDALREAVSGAVSGAIQGGQ